MTIDVDGTVLSTGLTVERARRGYNPHHRKVPSYFPITAHLAQTGHVVKLKNRSGNIHDGNAALRFLREIFADLQDISPGSKLEIRMDGVFFAGICWFGCSRGPSTRSRSRSGSGSS